MAADRQTNISLDVVAVLILHSAATKLAKINRAKNLLKGVETQDDELQATLDYTLERVKETIGA
jgi:hypothetical protein